MLSETGDTTASMNVLPGEAELSSALPNGTASTYLRDSSGSIAQTIRPLVIQQLGIAKGPTKFSYVLPANALDGKDESLEAVTMFRANEFKSKLVLRVAGGVRVSTDWHKYGPPSVTMFGQRKRKISTCFILDCSHSMRSMMAVEAPSDGFAIFRNPTSGSCQRSVAQHA